MTRNETIAALVEEGEMSLAAIGKIYGITRERVRKIARQEKATPRRLQIRIRRVLPFRIEVVIRNPWSLQKPCSYGTCMRPAESRGLCDPHYQAWAYHNLPGHKERQNRLARHWATKNPEKVKEANARARNRYRLRRAGLLPPAKREPVPKAAPSRRSRP